MKLKLREWAFRALYTLACKLSNATVWLFGCCYAWFPEYMMFADENPVDLNRSEDLWDDIDEDDDPSPQDQPDMFDGWEEQELQHLMLKSRMDRIIEGKDEPDAQERTNIPV